MIVIIMLSGDEQGKSIWESVIAQKDVLQSEIQDKGKLLYLTKRTGYNNTSLVVHLKDLNTVADLVTNRLSKIDGLSRVWVIPLFRPRFFPLPKDTHLMKRFVVTLKVSPAYLADIHKRFLNPNLPEGLKKVYYAFTFQLYDSVLQLSLLADNDDILHRYISEELNNMKGVLKTNIYEIEKTKPFITYEEWQSYAGEKASDPRWKNMLTHIE